MGLVAEHGIAAESVLLSCSCYSPLIQISRALTRPLRQHRAMHQKQNELISYSVRRHCEYETCQTTDEDGTNAAPVNAATFPRPTSYVLHPIHFTRNTRTIAATPSQKRFLLISAGDDPLASDTRLFTLQTLQAITVLHL